MKYENLLKTHCLVPYKDKLLFCSEEMAMIFLVDPSTGEIDFFCRPGEIEWYRSFFVWNEQLIMFPINKGKIWKYNITTSECKGDYVNRTVYASEDKKWSNRFIEYNNRVYLYGPGPTITEYDLKSGRLNAYGEWDGSKYGIDSVQFGTEAFSCNDKLYFHIVKTCLLLVLDVENNEWEFVKIDGVPEEVNIAGLAYSEGSVWVQAINLDKELVIYKGDVEKLFVEEVSVIKIDNKAETPVFSIGAYKDRLIMLPYEYKEGFVVNSITKRNTSLSREKLFGEYDIDGAEDLKFIYGKIIDGAFYSFDIERGMLCRISLINEDVESVRVLSRKFNSLSFTKEMLELGVVDEDSFCTLRNYLAVL